VFALLPAPKAGLTGLVEALSVPRVFAAGAQVLRFVGAAELARAFSFFLKLLRRKGELKNPLFFFWTGFSGSLDICDSAEPL
jgi:hypothetical protein